MGKTKPWKSVKSVRTSWDEPEALIDAFDYTETKHLETWLDLEPKERKTLLSHPHRRERWPNHIGQGLHYAAKKWIEVAPKNPKAALAIYDELLELPKKDQVYCWVDALSALLPTLTGLAIDEARCDRYLARCLPHAPSVQNLWWAVACVKVALGDDEGALDALEAAKTKGDPMEGPKDDLMFRHLWSHPRFLALTEGLEPPKLNGLDAIGDRPEEVRHLELDEVRGAVPERVRELVNLEVLELNGEKVTVPTWLAKLPLRKLKLWSWEPCVIPDEVLCMPTLEEVEGYSGLPEGWEATALNQLLKSFHKNDLPAEARPVHLALLVGRPIDDVSDEQLVEALGSTATKVHRAAQKALEERWAERRFEPAEGANVVLVGRLAADRSALKERLERLGMTLKRKATKKTIAIIVGPRHGGKALPYLESELPVMVEDQLHGSLDAHDVRHFEDPEEAEGVGEQLAELLLSTDGANVALALEMIKRGGLPDGLLHALFLAWQTRELDSKTRKGAKTLFERYASQATLDSVKKHLTRTNLFASGETKLAKRLKAITKESGGELDGPTIAKVILERSGDGMKYLLKVTKDPAERKALLEARRKGATLNISALELTRIPDEIGQLEGLRVVEAQGNRLNKLTEGLLSLSELESLDLSYNALTDVPESIAQLTGLRTLDLACNHFSSFPEALAQLTWLEELNFSSETYSPKMKMALLSDGIGELKGLKRLHLQAHRLDTLPVGLRELTELEELSIGSAHIQSLPSWLADLPALKEVEARYFESENAKEAEAVFEALTERGVTVTR